MASTAEQGTSTAEQGSATAGFEAAPDAVATGDSVGVAGVNVGMGGGGVGAGAIGRVEFAVAAAAAPVMADRGREDGFGQQGSAMSRATAWRPSRRDESRHTSSFARRGSRSQ